MASMIFPQFPDATGISLKGVQIDAADDGTFDVPEDLVAQARQMGAQAAPDPEPDAAPKRGKKTAAE